MPAKNRVTLTITLTPGADDDLLVWLKNVDADPDATRASAGRDLLRVGLGLPLPERQPVRSDTVELAALRQQMIEIQRSVQQAHTAPVSVDVAAMQEQINWAVEALHYLNSVIDSQGKSPAPDAPQVVEAPRVASDKLKKRKKNALKNKW